MIGQTVSNPTLALPLARGGEGVGLLIREEL
jgi:hypothetical protein